MSSVTFPTAIGGDGSTVSDDDNVTTGLRNGGWRTRFIPCFTNLVNIADYMVSYTAQTSTFAAPPPMGSTTPNTGAFTRVTVTGSTAPVNGMYLPGTNILGFATNSTERVRIDASGNVGIGTSSPSFPSGGGLAVYNSTVPHIKLSNSTTGDSATDGTQLLVSGLDFYIQQRESASVIIATNGSDRVIIDTTGWAKFTQNTAVGYLGSGGSISSGSASDFTIRSEAVLSFATGGSTERARIDSSGNLLVGTTSTISALNQTKSIQTSCGSPTNRVTNGLVQQSYGSSAGLPFVVVNTIGNFLGFGVDSSSSDNTLRFATVSYDGNGMYWGATYCPIKGGAYTNASDYRIKENISAYANGALEKINALRPVYFNVIPEAETTVIKKEVGFIAHELQEHIPEVVYGEKDAVEEDGRPKHQAVDYAKLTAVLVKAIQELSAELNELKAKVNA